MATEPRAHRQRRAGWLTLALVALTLAHLGPGPRADEPAQQVREGVSLSQFLAELQSRGLRILYSSDLVRPEMRVGERPTDGTPREQLDRVLAPHGLATTAGPGNTILVVRALFAQQSTGAIRGDIRSRDGTAIAGARLRIGLAPVELVADRHGAVARQDVAPGRYTLRVRAPGFLPRDVADIAVQAGQTTEIHFTLDPIAIVREKIRVTPDRVALRDNRPETRQTLTREDALQQPPGIADDALQLAGRLQGAGGSDSGAALNVRGGVGDEVLIVLDGLEVAQPFHLRDRGGLISIIDSAAIGRVDFLGGSFPAEYGGRMSGVLELSSVRPTDELRTGIGVGTSHARLQSRGTFNDGRGQWAISGRRGEPRAALDLAGADSNYEPLYYDLLQRLEYRLGTHTTLAGNLLLAHDNLEHRGGPEDAALHGGTQLDSLYRDHYAWLNLESDWSPRLHSRTVLSLAQTDSQRNVFRGDDLEVLDERAAETYALKQDWTFDLSTTHFLKWGAALSRSTAQYDYTASGTDTDPMLGVPVALDRAIDLNPTGDGQSLYVADRIQVAQGVVAELGLRVDRQAYSTFVEHTVSPRFDLAWEPSLRDTLRFGWGHFYQPQRIQDLQVEDGVEQFFRAQLAEHRSVGWEHAYASGLRLRLGAYQKLMSHLAPRYENLFDPFGFSPEIGADRVRIAPEAAKTQAIEIGLAGTAFSGRRSKTDEAAEPTAPAVRWWADYALGTAEDHIDGLDVPRNWDQRHTLNFGLSSRIGTHWSIALAGTAHSGRPTTAVTAESLVQPDGSTQIVPVLGPRNAERLEPFQRLDMRVIRSLNLRRSELRLFFDVTNLFDSENVCCVERFDYAAQTDGNVAVQRRDSAGLQRVVAFGASWEF